MQKHRASLPPIEGGCLKGRGGLWVLTTMKSTSYTRRHMGHFGRLAMLYYPDRGYKRAVHLFRQELKETRGLLDALQAIGYRGNERILTPRQVQVIEEFLGEA